MKKIKRNIILLACCITLFSSFVVSATSASNSITNGAATLTGSARMYDYSKKKDNCIMTAALGGKATEATSGSISGKIQGIDVKVKRMNTGNLNKKNKSYSDSKIVSDAYCVFTVTISLKGADSKEIYAHD